MYIHAEDGAVYALLAPTVVEKVSRSICEWCISQRAIVYRPAQHGREESIGSERYLMQRDTLESALSWFRMNHYPRGRPISAAEFERVVSTYSALANHLAGLRGCESADDPRQLEAEK